VKEERFPDSWRPCRSQWLHMGLRVLKRLPEISAGKGGLSSAAGLYLTTGHTTGTNCTSTPKTQLQLCCVQVICDTQQSSVHISHQCTCITLILLYSKGFPVEFCSSKDGECLTGPADGDQHLPTESKRCNTGNQMTASPGKSTNMNETKP